MLFVLISQFGFVKKKVDRLSMRYLSLILISIMRKYCRSENKTQDKNFTEFCTTIEFG